MEPFNILYYIFQMAITQKSIKILWSAAAGRCAYPECWEQLCLIEAEKAAPHTLGEMAHICGEKPGSNRHDPSQTKKERDDYQNLVLLCPTHHRLIDRKENEHAYPPDLLQSMKANHEAKVLELVDQSPVVSKPDLARILLPLLEANRQSWVQYGPLSEIARTQPYNAAVHAVWESERLSIIVPNNRKMVGQLKGHTALFDIEEQSIIASFEIHVRSYEQWVENEIPYSAVRRFPLEFDKLIRGLF